MLGKDGREVLSLASNDRMGDAGATRRLSRRWKRIKYPLMFLMGQRKAALRLMRRLTYGNWNRYCERVWRQYGTRTRIGFSGSAVVMTRRAIERFGGWDPSQQAADFDMFMRTVERHETAGDMQPMSVVSGIMHHHFRRLTLRCDYPPFKDGANLRTLEAKWGADRLSRYRSML